jgi:hypothetical protein
MYRGVSSVDGGWEARVYKLVTAGEAEGMERVQTGSNYG